MEKGILTKEKILISSMAMIREFGLDSLTIGAVASKVKMSKSGVFAHFQSRDELLLKVIEFAALDFKTKVFDKAMLAKRGLPRIQALSDYWIKWDDEPSGGCPFISASFEFDDRPGVIRDAIVKQEEQVQLIWETAAKIAIQEGHFIKTTDCKQFAYEIFGNILSYNLYKRLLKDSTAMTKYKAAFNNIISRIQSK